MGTTVFYSVDECDSSSRFEFELIGNYDLDDDFDLELIAESIAEDWHDNHDGWESTWPLNFSIYKSEASDKPLAIVNVERETRPEFSAQIRKN